MQLSEEDLYAISIHALREEGDAVSVDRDRISLTISIHALREEGDALLTAFTF